MAFGHALRDARQAAGLTQEAVANAAGMDRSFYVEVENAVHSTTLDRVCELADVLGVPLADLVSGPEFQPAS